MARITHTRRTGLSLIELLVVLAIFGVLVALLIPAVQKAREAALRAQCAHHLRQLALAVHLYHDAHQRIPYNQFGDSYGAGAKSHAWSWLARILPYIEQDALYIEGSIPSATLTQSGVADRTVNIFLCPADDSEWGPRLDAGNLVGFAVGLTNYKGVGGANWGDDIEGIGPYFATDWRNAGANGSFDGHANGDGIFYRMDHRRTLRFTGITDGTSHTFMIGEDVPALNEWCSWPYANNANATCAIPPNVEAPGGGTYPLGEWQNNESFRSRHPNGLQFAHADGSVRYFRNSIDLTVYRALATISGGEAAVDP